MRHFLILALSAALLMAACGNGEAGDTTTTPTTTAPAITTTSTTPPPATTTPEPPAERPVEALAWGLLCRDLVAAGWDYPGAVGYWNVERRPTRMDANENGIPCEAVYSAGDVVAYWGDPLPAGLAPGSGSGWSQTDRAAPVTHGCCSMNDNGPVSPPLPPDSGAFPSDGAYSVWVSRQEGHTDQLTLEIRRWLPCSKHPEHCSADLFAGDIYADPADSVVRTAALDASLTVVIRPIGHWVDEVWTDMPSLEGDGTALASLLRRMDAALTTFVGPPHSTGGDADLLAMGTADPTFPYGPSSGDESVLAYRGPESSYLTPNFWAVIDQEEPSWMFGWWCTLEIVDGEPTLFIWAGQIAG